MNIKQMFEQGITGTVRYNDVEDSYVLDLGSIDVGLYPVWSEFEGKKVTIKVEVRE